MEILVEQCKDSQSEEPCEEYTPKKEKEENFNISVYDYNQRLWF